ncbi:methyltransferase [Actinomycetaceae bacterium L2_0104]
MTSPEPTNASPTLLLDAALISRLRNDLTAAGWTASGVAELLSPMALAAMRRDQFVPAAMELESDGCSAAVLTRLFMLAEPVEGAAIESALPSLTVASAKKLGLVEQVAPGSSKFTARVDLRPYQGEFSECRGDLAEGPGGALHWWVASDLSQAQTGEAPREDYVLGIASASNNLARLTLRDPVDSALDLGCGCGVLALQLTSHAKRVVASDISERACNFTRFNALLNEADIDVRQGSFFEPVTGERFDLITSNPPFVITPQAARGNGTLEYRDGGMERDQLIPLIVREAVTHLAPGGTLQMLANWEVRGNEFEWNVRPKRWIEQAAEGAMAEGWSVDAWLVQRDLLDVAQYAEWWIRDGLGARVVPDEWHAEYRKWIEDFESAGTKFVGLGSLAMRVGVMRTDRVHDSTAQSIGGPAITKGGGSDDASLSASGPGATDLEEPSTGSGSATRSARQHLSRPGTAHLSLVCEYLPEGKPVDSLAVRTALDNLSLPDGWVDVPLVRAPDVREVRYFVPGSADPELIHITQGRAGGRERSVTSAVAALIGVSDGELAPAQVIPTIAMLLEQEEKAVQAEIETALPELLRSGVAQFSHVSR